MMRIILLLLVTLVGPFCAFTQASTPVVPTAIDTTADPNIALVPPAFTNKTEEAAPQDAVSTLEPAPEVTEAATSTEEVPVVSTAEVPLETTALTDRAQSTEAGPKETTGPETTTVTQQPRAEEPEAENTETPDVQLEDEGMGTGQLVGIVIGALIAVIVVIAVIILVVRRMGQYSP